MSNPTKHQQLKQAALEAAYALHSDTSVSMEKTLDSLQELHSHLTLLIHAVESDLAHQEGE